MPAYPTRKTVRTASGDVTVTLRGDEYLCFWLSDDGKAYRPQEDGTYAEIPAFELQQIREEAKEARSRNDARRAQKRRVGTITPRTGTYRGLVILVNFKDESFSVADPKAQFERYFNQKGYSDYGMTGSVTDYFEAQSYGQFHLQFDVVGPYELKYEKSHYGAPTSNGAHDTDARAMIVEACKMADADVNYTDYDWNKDGRLEQVYVIYCGRGENYTHDDNNSQAAGNKNIWPHEATIGTELRLDGVYLSTYACSCELRGATGSQLDGIGTACHEFSHCLGFPDMYDTASGTHYAMGFWDILCVGGYNNDGCTPAGYTSYERWQAGWLTPVEVDSETEVKDMKALTDAPEAYILYSGRRRAEYYLLENRQLTGFDSALYGHGLLVVHVDYDSNAWQSNSVNTGTPQRMTIIAADDRYTYGSEESDPFPGILGVTALTDYSMPAAKLNDVNSDGQALMHKPIEGIRESADGLLSFYLCREPLAVPAVSVSNVQETSFTASWPAVARATSYEVNLAGIPSKKEPSEARIIEEDFVGAESKSQGLTDISGKLSQYLSNKGFTGEQLYQSPSRLRFGTSSKAGTLKSPVQSALSTGKLTIVMTLVPFTEGTKVRGTLSIVTNTQPKEEIPFELATTQTFVLHPELSLNEVFRVDITAQSRMYIHYFALYDGVFSASELGFSGNVTEKVKRRVDVKTFTINETSITFNDLEPSYDYELSVRAVDDISTSFWSEVVTVPARGAGVDFIPSVPVTGQWYDLQGRPVAAPSQRGIYIRDGRKVAF